MKNTERRTGIDRREGCPYTAVIPERRSDNDRRKSEPKQGGGENG